MKTFIATVVGLLSPILLHAVGWANLDEVHHYSGPSLTEKDLEGKVVLVDNWGVNCPICRESLPRIEKIWKTFKSKPFVLIGNHCQGNAPDKVKELVAANKLTYPIYERVGLAEGTPSFKALPFIYVVNHCGSVVYQGQNDREAEKAVVTAIAEIGQPMSLIYGVTLPNRYKNLSKKMRLGATITGEMKKLKNEAASKNERMAKEAKEILDAIERTRGEVKAKIDTIKKTNPSEAVKMIKDYMNTWPKDSAEYKAELPELQKQAAKASECAR